MFLTSSTPIFERCQLSVKVNLERDLGVLGLDHFVSKCTHWPDICMYSLHLNGRRPTNGKQPIVALTSSLLQFEINILVSFPSSLSLCLLHDTLGDQIVDKLLVQPLLEEHLPGVSSELQAV